MNMLNFLLAFLLGLIAAITYYYYRSRNSKPKKVETPDGEQFFRYVNDQLNFNPKLHRLSILAEHIMIHRENSSQEVLQTYIEELESFSDDIVLEYYNKTGEDFFEQMDEAISYFDKGEAADALIKGMILKKIKHILSNTPIKKEMDEWNKSISDENE